MIASFSVPAHSGTGAGSAGSSAPSPTTMPSAAWTIDFAVLHEISGLAAVTGSGSGWNRFGGRTP